MFINCRVGICTRHWYLLDASLDLGNIRCMSDANANANANANADADADANADTNADASEYQRHAN